MTVKKYQNLEEVLEDVKLIINDFMKETYDLIDNEILSIEELIKFHPNFNNNFYSVDDSVYQLKDLADQIEKRKEVIKINILDLTRKLDTSLNEAFRDELNKKEVLEKELESRSWFAMLIKGKDSFPDFIKSKVRIEQLSKIVRSKAFDLINEINQKLNFNKLSNNILDITKTLKYINNLCNISELNTSKTFTFLELLELKNSLRDETKLLLNIVKEDINKSGQKWKDEIFKVKDLKFKGSLDNDRQLSILNQENFYRNFIDLVSGTTKKIYNFKMPLNKPNINYNNLVGTMLFSMIFSAGAGIAVYQYNGSKIQSSIDNLTKQSINFVFNNPEIKKINSLYKDYNPKELFSLSSFQNGKIDSVMQSTLNDLKIVSDYFISSEGNFDLSNQSFANIKTNNVIQIINIKNEIKELSLNKTNQSIEFKNNVIYAKKQEDIDII